MKAIPILFLKTESERPPEPSYVIPQEAPHRPPRDLEHLVIALLNGVGFLEGEELEEFELAADVIHPLAEIVCRLEAKRQIEARDVRQLMGLLEEGAATVFRLVGANPPAQCGSEKPMVRLRQMGEGDPWKTRKTYDRREDRTILASIQNERGAAKRFSSLVGENRRSQLGNRVL